MDTLGIVDSRSIAAGGAVVDVMLKAARVQLVRGSVVCAGRFLIVVEGARAEVETAVRAAEAAGFSLAATYIVANIAEQVLDILHNKPAKPAGRALGIVECRNAADSVMAADKAVKKAEVSLMRLVLGQGLGGKSFFVMMGDVQSVREATEEAVAFLGKNLVQQVVIPRPEDETVRALAGRIVTD